MFNNKKLLLASGLLVLAGSANAAYEFKLTDKDSITFGGYIKVDGRYVDGDVGYRDFWIGGGASGEDKSQIKFFANETRFNTKYVHGDVTGFIEMDFYGGSGNEIISNSYNPRIRHATIKYKNILVGQTWTTFMNTSSLAETADFGGPHVGESFVRNTQFRYSNGGFQVSLENPESYGGDPSEDSVPDFIAKYTFKGDWGNVSVAGLARQLNTLGGETESALGVSVAGRIKTTGKDDFRFFAATGNLGRYVGTVAATDLVGEEAEDSTSFMAAYRHFWSEGVRSTVFYGNTTTDLSDRDRSHWGVNLIKNYTPKLSFGAEFGQYTVDDQDADSIYAQVFAKYVL
jgi:hypothetical protein